MAGYDGTIFSRDKRKVDNFDPYNVFLTFATNIPQRLKTGFVVQGHICVWRVKVQVVVIGNSIRQWPVTIIRTLKTFETIYCKVNILYHDASYSPFVQVQHPSAKAVVWGKHLLTLQITTSHKAVNKTAYFNIYLPI